MQPVLKILPGQHASDSEFRPYSRKNPGVEEDFRLANGFPNAKAAIHLLMQHYGISRSDEVYIHTTSESNYVASCVTCTIFNYGKPSRVLTEQTKMIYVIHEFGYADPGLDTLLAEANTRGVPLVEDVAHSVNSFHSGKRLGTIGDYGLFSLPKFFDLPHGGLLLDNKNRLGLKGQGKGTFVDSFKERTDLIDSITEKKQEFADLFIRELHQPGFTYVQDANSAPFVVSIDFPQAEPAFVMAKDFQERFPLIELFPTHVPGRIAFPINPYAGAGIYKLIIEHIKTFF